MNGMEVGRSNMMHVNCKPIKIEDCREFRVVTVRMGDTQFAPSCMLTYKQIEELMPHFERILSEVE